MRVDKDGEEEWSEEGKKKVWAAMVGEGVGGVSGSGCKSGEIGEVEEEEGGTCFARRLCQETSSGPPESEGESWQKRERGK